MKCKTKPISRMGTPHHSTIPIAHLSCKTKPIPARPGGTKPGGDGQLRKTKPISAGTGGTGLGGRGAIVRNKPNSGAGRAMVSALWENSYDELYPQERAKKQSQLPGCPKMGAAWPDRAGKARRSQSCQTKPIRPRAGGVDLGASVRNKANSPALARTGEAGQGRPRHYEGEFCKTKPI